jgi:hypothetical protein
MIALAIVAIGGFWLFRPSADQGMINAGPSSPELSDQATPACTSPPLNGAILHSSGTLPNARGHVLEIRNGSGGGAIVKLKNAQTGRTAFSFFVADSATASLAGIPDGSYRIQFAFGNELDKSCANFVAVRAASQFPGVENLAAESSGDQTTTAHLIYTLYGLASGNVTPDPIDTAIFDAD